MPNSAQRHRSTASRLERAAAPGTAVEAAPGFAQLRARVHARALRDQRHARDLQPGRRLVGADRLARAGEQRLRARARAAPRAAVRAGRRARPSSTTTPRPTRRGTACAAPRPRRRAKPASDEQRGEPRPSSESENGPGSPGGGIGMPSSALTASNTTPSHGFCSRGPQTATATRPPGRRTRADLARRARRVGHEHQPLAAEDDVVRLVRLVDLLEVELARAHVREAERLGAGRARSPSSRARRPRARPRRPAPTSGAAAIPTPPAPHASSSTRSPGRGAASSSSVSVTRAPRAVDELRVRRPAAGDRAPHPLQLRAELRPGASVRSR